MPDSPVPPLPQGIISVLQTPFARDARIDFESLERLIESALAAGVHGFLAPAVASEVDYLSRKERAALIEFVARTVRGRAAFIVGASAKSIEDSQAVGRLARRVRANAWLVGVPEACYGSPSMIIEYFRAVAVATDLPLLIQDLQWSGPGMELTTITRLREVVPQLVGLKIETVPAGSKYTVVRYAFGARFFIAGGWAVPQMIEALDRGIDAMMPESSMVHLYVAIDRLYRQGRRQEALDLFRGLLPVLAFTNQEIHLSIAFFKRLLVRRRIFTTAQMRAPFSWDPFNQRIADELIDDFTQLLLQNRFKAPQLSPLSCPS